MATVVRMPEVLADASEATIQTWLVSVGETIAIGDPIAEIETDKAVVEYAAEVEGILAQLLAEPGTSIAVGEPIAVVTAPGEDAAALDPTLVADAKPREQTPATPVGAATTRAEAPDVAPIDAADRRLFATPLVRKIAREKGIDLATVTGTGPGGRIVRRDVDRVPAQTPVEAPTTRRTEEVPASELPGIVDIP